MTPYDAVRDAHIFAGTIGLATFWTSAALRKGSWRHRIVGQIFMLAMLGVTFSGALLAIADFLKGEPVRGAFLLYVVLITATPTWLAWRAVRDKHDIRRFTGRIYHALAWANLIAGPLMLALGIRYQVLIIAVVSLVGVIAGVLMLRFARRPPAGNQWWLPRHYGSIIGAGVATHVAFLHLGLSHILPSDFATAALRLSWFTPFVIALIARRWLDRKYGRRAAAAPAADVGRAGIVARQSAG